MMAYMSQERKAKLAPGIKKVLKKYGVKATISVKDLACIAVNVKEGDIDFFGEATQPRESGYMRVNVYYIKSGFTGRSCQFLLELIDAMNGIGTGEENWDLSDTMTDYFNVGWYTAINIGTWEKPYKLTA